MQDPELHARIATLAIGPTDATLSFLQRLATENGWTTVFTSQVLTEYRRFIYLAAISDRQVTPSDAVDQAWHLHLSYTRDYWQGLCDEVLGVALHHQPTAGGASERQRFEQQYANTLVLYQREFGHPAPAGIWPSVRQRFAGLGRFVRVNHQRAWVINKPPLPASALLTIATLPLLLAACSTSLAGTDIWFWLKVALAAYIAYRVLKWLGSAGGGGGSGGGSGCGGCGGD